MTDFENIVACVLQRDTFVSYIFILCLDSVILTSSDLIKDNGYHFKKQEVVEFQQKLWLMQTTPRT